MSFERRQLSADTLAALRQLPGCISCDVLHAVPVPATLRIRMAGLLDNDQFIGVFSLNGDLVPKELQQQWMRPDGPVPIILNPQVIPLFNIALAERYHLPQISPDILLGAGVTLEFGRDRFMSLSRYASLPARFVGYHAQCHYGASPSLSTEQKNYYNKSPTSGLMVPGQSRPTSGLPANMT